MRSYKRPKHEEHENQERWLVSYADFITLLFAFFVVLYATSNNDKEKQEEFEKSVRKELKLTVVGNGGQPTSVSQSLIDLASPIAGFPRKGGPGEAADYILRELGKSMSAEEKQNAIQDIRHDAVGVRISLAAANFFQMGSYKLKRTALKDLDKLADILRQTKRKIIVEGHTDDIPVKSEEVDSNWQLASLRATSVLRYLTQVQKIDPARIVLVSYADQKPLVPNTSEENRAKNRRVEILLVSDEKLNPLE